MHELKKAIREHQTAFGLDLTDPQLDRLTAFYDIILEHNPILHLVAPCSSEEFAIRHILESLTLLKYLPQDARFADVGTGAGLPSIPCLLVREDLTAVLIESKEKKAAFLNEAVEELNIAGRSEIVNKQYAEADIDGVQIVTCRALDKFTDKLPHLIRWTRPRRMLLFGGEGIGEALQKQKLTFEQELMPLSERRYLFVVSR